MVPSRRGRIDPALLFDAAPGGTRPVPRSPSNLSFTTTCSATRPRTTPTTTTAPRRADDAHADHLHSAYDTLSLESAEPLDPRAFAAFMERGFPGVYRMKGSCALRAPPAAPTATPCSWSDATLSYTRSGWPRGQQPATTLVAIGAGFDAAALRDGFAACTRAESTGPVCRPGHRHGRNPPPPRRPGSRRPRRGPRSREPTTRNSPLGRWSPTPTDISHPETHATCPRTGADRQAHGMRRGARLLGEQELRGPGRHGALHGQQRGGHHVQRIFEPAKQSCRG
ncbi:GTP-binding protein [Yinghuangia aomiensis]